MPLVLKVAPPSALTSSGSRRRLALRCRSWNGGAAQRHRLSANSAATTLGKSYTSPPSPRPKRQRSSDGESAPRLVTLRETTVPPAKGPPLG